MIEIRQAKPEDEPRIRDFLLQFYGPRFSTKYPERWKWQIAQNPFAPTGSLPVLLALDDGKVVGQLALQYGSLWSQGDYYPCAWGVDFGVLPAYRGKGIGHRLQDLAARTTPFLLSASMDISASHIKEKLGFISGPRMSFFRRYFSLMGEDVHRLLQHKLSERGGRVALVLHGFLKLRCGAIWSAALNQSSRAYARLTATRRPSRDYTVTEFSKFGPECDALWEKSKADYPMATPRTTRFLNWRFLDCPGLRYRRFRADRDGSMVAYLVVRERTLPERRGTVIVDMFCSRSELGPLGCLLHHAVDLAQRSSPSIEAACSDSFYARACREAGFLPAGRQMTWIGGTRIQEPSVRAQSASWFVTLGDHDCDQFRPLNGSEECPASASSVMAQYRA